MCTIDCNTSSHFQFGLVSTHTHHFLFSFARIIHLYHHHSTVQQYKMPTNKFKRQSNGVGSKILNVFALATIFALSVFCIVQVSTTVVAPVKVKQAQDRLISNLPADGFPRILIAGPCSGSSAIVKFTKVILESHGYDVFHGSEPLLRPEQKNVFYVNARTSLHQRFNREPTRNEILSESLVLYNQKSFQTNRILLIKANSIPKLVIDTLKTMGARFAFTYRSNVLDRAVCAVRDCFLKGDPIGCQVFSNGTRADMCFNRRHIDEKLMANFDTDKLHSYMEYKERQNEDRIGMFTRSFSPSTFAAYEDLFKFEYSRSEETLKESVHAWTDLLQSFGDINKTTVEAALMPYWDTRPKNQPHSTVIFNIEEVKGSLLESPFETFLRK